MNKLLYAIPILVLALIAIAFAIPSFGEGRGHYNNSGSDQSDDFMTWKFDRLSKDLNLTPDQQSKLNDLKTQMTTSMKSGWQSKKDLHNQLKTELSKDNPDMGKIGTQMDQQIDQRAQAQHPWVSQMTAFANSLNADQKKTFASEFLDRHMHGHGQQQ